MKGNVFAAAILALGLVVAGYLAGGRYELVHVRANELARIDRFTGEVEMCVNGAAVACGFVVEK